MKRLLTDPAWPLLALGAGFYVLLIILRGEPAPTVVISETVLRQLEQNEVALEGRALEPAEIASVEQGFIDDEVLLHEAIARGVHLSDSVTRRRLVSLVRSSLTPPAAAVPTPGDLLAWYEAHPELFVEPPRTVFTQVVFPWSEPAAEGAVASTMKKLEAGADPTPFGASSLVAPKRLAGASRRQLVPGYGTAFVDALDAAPQGVWTGPIDSRLGRHLVFVEQRLPESRQPFEDVRAFVAERWAFEEMRRRQAEAIAEVRQGYDVVHVP